MNLGRDLGDFPTPPELVAAVLDRLGPIGRRWPRVLEPTCGRGHFLSGLLEAASPPREIRGIEVQEAHWEVAQAVARGACSAHVEVTRANLFALDLRRDLAWRERGPLLVVGNPPWITNAELGVLGSNNLPPKSNVKSLRGIDARTGASNFDIAEAIWLKLIAELAGEEDETTIALLCKTTVARSVLEHLERAGLPASGAALYRLDARRWFRASVDACLFRVTLGRRPRGRSRGRNAATQRVPVYRSLESAEPESAMGYAGGRLVADVDAYRPLAFADGRCALTWRQGVKHDAAAVMELQRDPAGRLRNKLGEPVEVEPGWVYPLLKGADLLRPRPPHPTDRAVIVTQERLGMDTRPIEREAPRLWAYLGRHGARFQRRKSSIYRGRPPFAMFGLGPYSFAPYKVAVSGLSKAPRFHAIGPAGGRPVMLDDTCYFLPFRSPEPAALASALLNDPATLSLIGALLFREAKRPVTKALLARLDLGALAGHVDRTGLLDRAEEELARLVADGPALHGDDGEDQAGSADLDLQPGPPPAVARGPAPSTVRVPGRAPRPVSPRKG